MVNIMAKVRLSIREDKMMKISMKGTSNSAKNMGRGIIMIEIGLIIVLKVKGHQWYELIFTWRVQE